jgi:hypothetical protein
MQISILFFSILQRLLSTNTRSIEVNQSELQI